MGAPAPWSVVFPRRWSLAGVFGAGLLAAGLGVWVARALALSAGELADGETAQVPWLAVVLLVAMTMLCLLSLRQLIVPWRQVDVDADGLLIRRRRRRGETFIAWRDVAAIDYHEHDDARGGQSVRHKVVRLRLRDGAHQPVPARFFEDDSHLVHLDAFAAEPGGAELARRLDETRRAAREAAEDATSASA